MPGTPAERQRAVSLAPTRVDVRLPDGGYEIVIGEGLLGGAARFLAERLPRRRAIVVSDETVARLHAPTLSRGLQAAGIATTLLTVPPGEGSKSFAEVERLVDALEALRVERSEPVLALGGGVVGDLAGFVAAVRRRGSPFVQLPTTLLAQVDSAVGGKTAINTRHGKNLVGAFHQPALVLSDVGTLASLPRREKLAGYAEMVKYGLLGNPAFFAWLERNGRAVLAGDSAALVHAVAQCCRDKAAIVARDEREMGERALLNLGHTFAHALEAEAGFGARLLHGEAVALGCVMAFELSARLGHCPTADVARVLGHFAAVGLPSRPAELGLPDFPPERLLQHMAQDKKVRDGRLTFILVRGIGQAFISRAVEAAEVAALLRSAAAA